jgi:hypothetical protein
MRPIKDTVEDWRRARSELEAAEAGYSKFLILVVESDNLPGSVSLDEMKAASDKLMVARGKERRYLMEYLKASR